MKLQKVNIDGIDNTYMLDVVEKEFRKAVNETWKDNPPWQRYQKKLIGNLAVLDMDKEQAIDLPQFEKLSGETDLYCIRQPEARKNIRVIYTIEEGDIILLVAFLENNDGDYRRAIKVAKDRLKWLYS